MSFSAAMCARAQLQSHMTKLGSVYVFVSPSLSAACQMFVQEDTHEEKQQQGPCDERQRG